MKNFLLSTAAFSIIMASSALWSQTKIEEIEQYEIKSYDPQKTGLTDLVFEARIDNLTEILNKTQTFGHREDIHFKIYWLSPSQYKIEVLGLPKGFQEVKNDLATLIKGKLEFIIPERFSEKLKAYSLKAEPVADGKLIKAIDDTYTMTVPEVNILFDKAGLLKTVETKGGQAPVKTEFFQSPKAWSNNKLVTITNAVEYLTVAGMGFPSKITVKNVSEGIIPATDKEKEKKVKNETGTVIRFSKYEVNTGKAKRFMMDGQRR